MRVILKKSLDDAVYMGIDHDILDMNKLNQAITRRYLPRWSPSPLLSLLLEKIGTLKPMYLHLMADCERDGKSIKTLRLTLDIQDDVDRWAEQVGIVKVNWENVMDSVRVYFQSIGYEDIICNGGREIGKFVNKLMEDVPIAAEFFEIQHQYPEEIARIGFFGKNGEYEAYIKTDDELAVPHFHIRNSETKGGKLETCVMLAENKYCLHDYYKDALTPEQQALLMEFMKGQDRCKPLVLRFDCFYEFAVAMWQMNNNTPPPNLKYDGQGNMIIPDYAHLK